MHAGCDEPPGTQFKPQNTPGWLRFFYATTQLQIPIITAWQNRHLRIRFFREFLQKMYLNIRPKTHKEVN